MLFKTSILVLCFVVVILTDLANTGRTRRRRLRGRWGPKDYRRARKNIQLSRNNKLVGPLGNGPVRVNIPPINLAIAPVGRPSSPPPRYYRGTRPQLSADFGHRGAMPGKVPPSSIIRPPVRSPPRPNLSPNTPDTIQQLSDKEKEDIALVCDS